MAIVTGLRPNRTRVKMLQDFVKSVFASAKGATQQRIAAAPDTDDQAFIDALTAFSKDCDDYYLKMDEVEAFIQKKGGDPKEYEKTLDEKLSDLSTRYGGLVARLATLDEYSLQDGKKTTEEHAFAALRKSFSGCQSGDQPGLLDILYRTAEAAEVLEKEHRFVDERYVTAVNEQYDAVLTEAYQRLIEARDKMNEEGPRNAFGDQAYSLYVRQCAQVDTLASQTNAALNTRRAHQLHQDIAVSGLTELMGEEQAKQFDPLHPEQALYGSGGQGVGALRYLPKTGRNNTETALAALGGYGWQLPTFQFGKRKVRIPVPGLIGRFGDLPIIRNFLKPALVIRPSSSGSFTKGLEVASANWRQKGMGLLGKDREEALRLLIFSLAERLRAEAKEKGESLDMSAAELFLNCPEDLGPKAMEFAIAAGFHPKNVSAYAERDMGYQNISEKDKAYEGQLKSFASLREEYGKNNDKKYHDAVRALESKHLGEVYEKDESGFVRPSSQREVKVRKASAAHLLGTRSAKDLPLEGEMPVRQTEDSVPAREIRAHEKTSFFERALPEQENAFFSANAEQRLSLLSDESETAWSLNRKLDYFARLSAQEQAQLVAADLRYQVDGEQAKELAFSHPVLMKQCIAHLDNQSAYNLYLALRLPRSDLGELRRADARLLHEGLGRLMVLSMTGEQREYTKENIAKQNLMESGSAAYSKRLVGPLGSHLREKHVAAEAGFQSGPVAWKKVEEVFFKTTSSNQVIANMLDQLTSKGLDAIRATARMNQVAKKLSEYTLPDRIALMNLMLHPEKLFERGLLSKEDVQTYLSDPNLSLSAKAAIVSSDSDFASDSVLQALFTSLGNNDADKMRFLQSLTLPAAMEKTWAYLKKEKGGAWEEWIRQMHDPSVMEVVIKEMKATGNQGLDYAACRAICGNLEPVAQQKWLSAIVAVEGDKAYKELMRQATPEIITALFSKFQVMKADDQNTLLGQINHLPEGQNKRDAVVNALSAWPVETEKDRQAFVEALRKLPQEIYSDEIVYHRLLPTFSSAWQETAYCEAVTRTVLPQLLAVCQHPVEVMTRLNWPEEKVRDSLIAYIKWGMENWTNPTLPRSDTLQAIQALAARSREEDVQEIIRELNGNGVMTYLTALFSPERRPPIDAARVQLDEEQRTYLQGIYPDDSRFDPPANFGPGR